MLFFYKFFTFSQLPNKFYITKLTTTHTSAPTENPLPPTHQHPQKIHYYPHKKPLPHNTETTKTPPPTPPQQQQQKIRDQREKADRRWDWPRGEDRSASGGWRDRPRGGRDRSSSGKLHVARSWRREADGVISPACLVAWSRSLSLSLFASLSPKMVWNENKNLKQFLGQNLYFTVKWNVFPEKWWGVKWFPEMVWNQNKRTLSSIFNPYM